MAPAPGSIGYHLHLIGEQIRQRLPDVGVEWLSFSTTIASELSSINLQKINANICQGFVAQQLGSLQMAFGYLKSGNIIKTITILKNIVEQIPDFKAEYTPSPLEVNGAKSIKMGSFVQYVPASAAPTATAAASTYFDKDQLIKTLDYIASLLTPPQEETTPTPTI